MVCQNTPKSGWSSQRRPITVPAIAVWLFKKLGFEFGFELGWDTWLF